MGGGDVSQDGSTPTSRDITVRLMSRVHMLLVRCLISPRRWGQEVNSVYSWKKAQMLHYVTQHHRQERLSYMPSATHINCDKPAVVFGVTDVDCVNTLSQNIMTETYLHIFRHQHVFICEFSAICIAYPGKRGSWLRHCATSRKVAVSIPDCVIGFFIDIILPSGRPMALESTQPLTEMSTRNISWGVKAGSARGWQPYHLHVLPWNLRISTSWNPQSLSRPVQVLL